MRTAAVARDASPLEQLLGGWRDGDGPSIHADGRAIPAGRLLPAARVVARRLVEDGIESGDLVLLLLRNSPEYLATALGVMLAGGVAVPVNARFTAPEIEYFFEYGRPRAWIAEPQLADRLRAAEHPHPAALRYEVDLDVARPLDQLLDWAAPGRQTAPVRPVSPADTAAIFFTAGTTGRPKGACTSHEAVAAFCDVVARELGVDARDRVILPMPMFYTGGLKVPLAVLASGADLILFREWKPADLVEAMDEHQATLLWGVPSVWALMIRSAGFDARRVQSLRVMWRGGSLTPRKIIDELREIFPTLPHYQSYGLTECNMSTMEPDSVTHGESCGFPTAGTQVTIEGQARHEEPGEIWVRGRQQFSAYFNDPGRTAETLVDGWVRTGDQGWISDDGRLRVLGRGSDFVIRGGENVSTTEVERVLVNIEGVDEAAVIGVPDDVFGHELRAVVVSRDPSVTAERVRAACGAQLAEYKVPKFVDVDDQPLPKNPVGKVQKSLLQ